MSSRKKKNNFKKVQEELQRAFKADKDLKGYGLKVEVVEGKARLQGIVDTLIEKERATNLAQDIPGVEKVDNAISISTDGPITDSEVEFEVAEELAQAPGVELQHIGGKSHRGTVLLKGEALKPHEIEAARRAAAKARGVKRVISQVKVKKPLKTLEEIFHSQVRNDKEDS
ncbi:hyperosmotically inducible protein [Thermanaeromonas toyohensis ToBE]|uniref:Hyperosmotically inducible protein n=1 Tax=Thermanaeromonas toyohensis ToBE TaxID=698762 RepID=A0A1W1VCI4_9FIRM|nr:BON domain-containing protein [Thermanaeromonas toyohensis]SMB91119.1 hyperosmotically inducible protein [Thermanaeromonas toyohensis ToBE]